MGVEGLDVGKGVVGLYVGATVPSTGARDGLPPVGAFVLSGVGSTSGVEFGARVGPGDGMGVEGLDVGKGVVGLNVGATVPSTGARDGLPPVGAFVLSGVGSTSGVEFGARVGPGDGMGVEGLDVGKGVVGLNVGATVPSTGARDGLPPVGAFVLGLGVLSGSRVGVELGVLLSLIVG